MTNPTNTQSKTAFDPTKPVQTRDGRKARIICTDRVCAQGSIVALVEPRATFPMLTRSPTIVPHPNEVLKTYYSDGSYLRGDVDHDDLVNVPEVTTKISNVYRRPTKGTKGLWSDYPGVEKKDMPYSEYIGYLEWKFEDGEPVSAKFVKDSQ